MIHVLDGASIITSAKGRRDKYVFVHVLLLLISTVCLLFDCIIMSVNKCSLRYSINCGPILMKLFAR